MTTEAAETTGIADEAAGARVAGFVVSDLMAALLALAGVSGVVFERPALTAVGTLVLMLALVCRIWARASFRQLEYGCETSTARAMEGEEVTLDLLDLGAEALVGCYVIEPALPLECQ